MASSTPDALWASRSVRLLRPAAVTCSGVCGSLDGRRLLDGVNLFVPVGARLLLIAQPQEAGSLLLRVLAGLVWPSAGRIRMAGLERRDASTAGWARRVAYVGPRVRIHPWLTPAEALILATRLAGYDPLEARQRIEATAERHGLSTSLDTPIGRAEPALGERTVLAAALVTEPEVVLLDEPLPAVGAEERARLLALPGDRRTVLWASPLPVAETGLVDRVALLRDGRIAVHARTSELTAAGLPLSVEGVSALADTSRPGPAAGPVA